MYEVVARSASFDLSKPDQVASLEVVLSMLELPQGMLWATVVKHIAH